MMIIDFEYSGNNDPEWELGETAPPPNAQPTGLPSD